MRKVLSLAIVVALGIYGYFHTRQPRPEAELARPAPSAPAPYLSLEQRAAAAQGTTLPADATRVPVQTSRVEREVDTPQPLGMQCDGRQYCSQMHSCAEASWFLQHCPDTKMDGDNDGLPCEQQWCDENALRHRQGESARSGANITP